MYAVYPKVIELKFFVSSCNCGTQKPLLRQADKQADANVHVKKFLQSLFMEVLFNGASNLSNGGVIKRVILETLYIP